MMAREVFGKLEPRDDSMGVEHELLLWDRRPEVWHRWKSFGELRRFYLEKTARDGMPDVVLMKNLSPSYNHFIRWLRRQQPRPLIVWLLADAGSLGQKISFFKRLRYIFKPMVTLDDNKAVSWFDACISFSSDTRQLFESLHMPWLWMPAAFNFLYEPPVVSTAQDGPIRFGYFGTLGGHSHALEMTQAFLDSKVPGQSCVRLRIWGGCPGL